MIDLTPQANKLILERPADFKDLQGQGLQFLGHEPPDSEGWIFVRPAIVSPNHNADAVFHLCQALEAQVNAVPNMTRWFALRCAIHNEASKLANDLRVRRQLKHVSAATSAIQALQTLTWELNVNPNPEAVRRKALAVIAHMTLLLELQPEWGAREAFLPKPPDPKDAA